MYGTSNSRLTPNARTLRKNMTKEERKLWYNFLCTLPCKVHRQYVIGTYIVDAQHYEDSAKQYDSERDAFLRANGITVLRYSNLELNYNFKGVCEDIWNHLPDSITS